VEQSYKIVCVSMYTWDIERLDAIVKRLKARGVTNASRSGFIRAALDLVDVDKLTRESFEK
jgi:hypothetical protein